MDKHEDISVKEKDKQRNLEILKKLRPIDDDFMRCIFKDNIELTQVVLRIILGKKDLIVDSVKTQADMKRLVGARSLCLDVYGTDANGNVYDIEIQRADKGARPKRARYHSSVMDVENLGVNEEFEKLPESYTIFITEGDVYKMNKAVYPIERINTVTNKNFDDGEHILYVNGSYEGDNEIGHLMHDFLCSNPHEMYNKELRDVTIKFKEQEEGICDMCELLEQTIKEREQRGIAIGEQRGIAIGEQIGEHKGRILEFFQIYITEFKMLSKEEILQKAITKFPNLSRQDAEELFQKVIQETQTNKNF